MSRHRHVYRFNGVLLGPDSLARPRCRISCEPIRSKMNVSEARIFPGAYHDSAVLMQLQQELLAQEGIQEAGAVMGTPANRELLREVGLQTPQTETAKSDDLIVVVKAVHLSAAHNALNQIERFLEKRRHHAAGEYRPKSLEYAVHLLPEARWVLVSVPGEYASAVAQRALDLERNVFLFSDHVSLTEELALKQKARGRKLMVMGPDCGTAILDGIGLGFANQVRRGPVGLVGASGTGLQQIACLLHTSGTGISQVFGCGGRDLSSDIGGITALQCLDYLEQDAATHVRVLVSKPPDTDTAEKILSHLATQQTPTVVLFLGQFPVSSQPLSPSQSVLQAESLDHAANLVSSLLAWHRIPASEPEFGPTDRVGSRKWLRGLFAGGTLATETVDLLARYGVVLAHKTDIVSPHPEEHEGHWILDLGDDDFTRGRLHPIQDNQLRIRYLLEAARHPETAVILFDLVLGYGAHADPAADFVQAISTIRAESPDSGPLFMALVVGTDSDPQGLARQILRLEDAGIQVFSRITPCVQQLLTRLETDRFFRSSDSTRQESFAAINVGLETFAQSIRTQGGKVLQVAWSPPPPQSEELRDILSRMR